MRHHETHTSIQAARHRFFDDGQAPRGLIPDTILASWQRCLKSGLSVAQSPRLEPLEHGALGQLKERHELLRRLCRPELETLYASARATGGIVVLTAPDGIVLDALGSPEFLDKAGRVALRPGVSWSEREVGTNAIGTAMVERRPVEVRGGEHYFAPHGVLSCSASPIFDPQGAVAGVLDLSGPASTPHSCYALGMVRLAVEQIEYRLFEQAYAGHEIVHLHSDPDLLGTSHEGLLVFEGHRLVAANRHALRLLGLDAGELGRCRYDQLFASALPRPGGESTLRSHAGELLHARRGEVPRTRPAATPAPATAATAAPRAAAAHPAPSFEPVFDAGLQALLERGVRLLDADIPILLQGETGTGKDLLARELHRRSRRAGAPFVAINCAALPESLIEAELFGYAPGAFTGARREGKSGLLREADGGVLFLDEIGDMPLALQSRLLRVLQEREVTPLGGGRTVPLDFAVVAASHRDLQAALDGGQFRADLYYRIAQSTLSLPPLRERGDLPALIAALWRSLGAEQAGMRLAEAAMARLAGHAWPGNLRELTGVLRTLLALGEPGATLGPEALPEWRSVAPAPDPGASLTLDNLEREAMRHALDACAGNVSAAARRLGVSRSTLYRRLKD